MTKKAVVQIIKQVICLCMVAIVLAPILLTLFAALKTKADMAVTSPLLLPAFDWVTFENFKEVLTDKYLQGIPDDSRIARDARFLHASDLTEHRLAQIRQLNELAGQRGQTLAQMALSWVLKDDAVCSVLIGASKPEQIVENISVAQHASFTEQELAAIEEICR